jgi:hypothetical protein
MERMHGCTPDISMFRFKFWETVWYYEPTAKYPSPNFLPGRFVGIAWDHGDAFTYEIWTCPDGKWEPGCLLIRNVVRGRVNEDSEPKVDYAGDALEWTPKVKAKTRKRKRKSDQLKGKKAQEHSVAEDATMENDETSVDRLAAPRVQFAPLPPRVSTDPEEQGGKEDAVSGLATPGSIQPNTTSKLIVMDATINPKRSRSESDAEPVDSIDYDPFEDKEPVEMVNAINDSLSVEATASEVGGSRITEITDHKWYMGNLQLKVVWDAEQSSWETFRDMKEESPKLTAKYIVDNKVSRSKRSDRNLQWANKVLRDMDRAVRRIVRLYDFFLNDDDDVYTVRRVQNKKKRKYSPKPTFKYGVLVPQSVRQALEYDKENGNTLWYDAMEKEMSSLARLECFEFKPEDHQPSNAYQKTTLKVIFEVKQDLRRKARLVAGGHLIDVLNHDVYSSTVKGISVRILHVIAHQQKLDQLCGDVTNAFVNAYTNEKVYARAGLEFGKAMEGKIVIIKKALYGLASSAERWHSHFADTLRGLNFVPTRYDPDVWIRMNESGTGYEYVCTHVDDFMIIAKKPAVIMAALQDVYQINESSIGPPEYYLGNDYKKDRKGRWCIGCKKYLGEAIKRVESMFGVLNKYSVPMPAGDHPELDTSELLSDDEHKKYQMLIGMLIWIVVIGRLDVCHATSSLSRFTACPRKGHLERAIHIFGFLKKRPNRRIVVDSRDPIFEFCELEFEKDYVAELKEHYPDAVEEIDRKIPEPLFDELAITVFVDSDHAHDVVTRRSVTGLIIFVGRTPVFYSSKRQGAVETSTYGAEFCAMRTAAEETIAVRYMLRCLGVKVEHSSYVFGDNLGVIQNVTTKDSLLKKKHVAISYHRVREAAAAGIIHPVKIDGTKNYADMLTKSLSERVFCGLTNGVMHG